MSRFKLLYFVIFVINLCRINAQISDKRLCVDEECKVPISYAKTLLRYSSPDSRILSFAPNVDITIYSKSAGSREDLWGGEINGKRGYIPKHMVRETKILEKPTLLVDTELSNNTDAKQVPSQVEPDKVQEPYEVVDGTTIYLSPQDINPTSTENSIQNTALPAETNKIQEAVDSQTVSDNISPEKQSPQTQESQSDDQNVANNKEELVEGGELQAETAEEDIDEENPSEDDDEEADEGEEEDDADEDSDEDVQDNIAVDVHDNVEKTDIPETDSLNNVEADITTESTKEEIQTVTTEKSEELEAKIESTETILNEDVKSEVPQAAGLDVLQQKESEDSKPAADPVEEPPAINIPKEENYNSGTESSSHEEVVQLSEDTSNEATLAPVEVTTFSPEIEVPQPPVDDFSVTPNPLEETEAARIVPETIPTLPPLGLFAASTGAPDVSQENVQSPETGLVEDIVEGQSDQNSTEEEPDDVISQNSTEEATVDITHQNSAEAADEDNQSSESVAVPEDSIGKRSIEFAEDASSTESNEVEEPDNGAKIEENEETESGEAGILAGVMSYFGSNSEDPVKQEEAASELTTDYMAPSEQEHIDTDDLLSSTSKESFCDATSCPQSEGNEAPVEPASMDFFSFNSDVFLYLVTTAISVIIFLFGYIAFDKNKREGPLIARINNLEKQLLVVLKEKEILQEKVATESGYETNDRVPNEVVENLKQDLLEMTTIKNALEEQVQSLEKELENSTEVGMELNRMLSEILSSESGSDVLKANVEHLQRQLVEQQSTINSVNETLAVTNTENHELRLELELSNKKVLDLQTELDKLLLNILKIEEEKESQQSILENEIASLRQKCEEIGRKLRLREEDYSGELKQLKTRLEQTERKLELKTKEHTQLADTFKQLKTLKNNEATVQNLLEVGATKAELQLLKSENQRFAEKIQQDEEVKTTLEKRAQAATEEVQQLKEKYDEADKLRVETQTKLEVLSNYFKDREAQWQKEISKHEALWAEKEGEATSTTERIKFMQEQLQNYKAQTESLKQEIMSQEIELKSQISVLEKKAHENWVSARQAERKLEEAKQEGAQLRHRLTLRERAIQEDKNQHRLQSPIEQNGDMPVSPLESPASPPLLYGTRDHITKSPPLPGLPPFLPPPPGVPFMPPPIHGVPPFMPPPPPNMFPGDHRPPPLGRMSSPPLNSRYSPSSRGYSPYDRNSSSPSDSEYGTSPPHRRAYSPFNNRSDDRRDYKRPPPGRSNGRNLGKGGGSSGSGHSNESLEKISRQQSKV